MNDKPTIAVLYHIFYEDSCKMVCDELKPLCFYNPVFLFNICTETPDRAEISRKLKECFPGCLIIGTSNMGKDIGAKLALFQLLIELEIEAEYLLLLHDKKSLQALKSRTWKNDLLHILSPESIKKTLVLFEENKKCGIIATKSYIIIETVENGKFINVNGKMLEILLQKYNLKLNSFAFVAGTMFWARAKPLKDFFIDYNPLEIRSQLESGNVIDNFSGTITHSWERILSWIISGNGYYLEGI